MTGAGPDDGGQPFHAHIPHAQRMIDGGKGCRRVTQFGGKRMHRQIVEGSVKTLSSESLGSFGTALGGISGRDASVKSVIESTYRNHQRSREEETFS